jgi:hypothetical protein
MDHPRADARDHARAARRRASRREHALGLDACRRHRAPRPRTRCACSERLALTAALRLLLTAAATALLAGCGGSGAGGAAAPSPGPPIGVGPSAAYMPPARGAPASAGTPIRQLRCAPGGDGRVGAHVELFAQRRVVVVPAGIGMAPPLRAGGAYVRAARCSYPVRTREPTGLVELDPQAGPLTLGDLFAIWGQPLSGRRLAGFDAPAGTRVAAYLDGRPWAGDPRALPLRRHAVIVLEIGGHVPPHATYRYPAGL